MSEKLDGIRAYWDGKNLLTRDGKIIYAPKYFTKDYPPFEIDGELWSKRDDFENISSIVRDKIIPIPKTRYESIFKYSGLFISILIQKIKYHRLFLL